MDKVNTGAGNGRRTALWASAAIIAVLVAGVVGGKTYYEAKVSELLARSGATARSVEVDFLGQVHVRDVTLPFADGKNLKIAAIDGRPKFRFLDGALEFSDVNIDVPTGTISMAHARVENAAFEEALRSDIPSDGSAKSLAKRLEQFAAVRIFTPEMTVTQSIASAEQKVVYKNVALSDIAGGRIAQYTVDAADYDIQMQLPDSTGQVQKKRTVVATGAIVGQAFDAAYMARLYTEKAGPEDKEAKPVYGPVSVQKISFSEGEGRFSYDEIRSDGFTARMQAEPLLDTLKTLTTLDANAEPSPQEMKAIFAKAVSVLDMIGKSNMQLLGFKADMPNESEGLSSKRVMVGIDRMDMQMDGRKVSFGLNGMSLKSGDDTFEVGEASLKGFDWSATIDGLSEIIGLEDRPIEALTFTRLIPELGRMRLAGINVDVAAPEKTNETTAEMPERVQFKLKNFEMGLTKPYNGIPTDIDIRQDELSVPIPADSPEEVFVEARKLGLEAIAFSYAISAGWDEPNKNLLIREISLRSQDFGSINLSGLVSGFTEEFFTFDTGRAQAAMFGLAGREMELVIRDEGMMAKAIKLYALQNEMTEDQVRGALTFVSSMMLQRVAAEQPKLQATVEALLKFISSPGTLTVTVKSNGANGLGLLDLVAASENPMGLLDKVDIQTKAE
ncbi:hypothetical protein RU07_16290 [Agrobacterium tumefaciens]|uniref:DUF945 domain-containing protein n=1 Tax=Agrobacterium tumefaciens TaxID=358 RepID=A0A0D0KUW2_AGRTU|nr:hypothetical protein RU07_16290 [Agrobacterium tumefaciens]